MIESFPRSGKTKSVILHLGRKNMDELDGFQGGAGSNPATFKNFIRFLNMNVRCILMLVPYFERRVEKKLSHHNLAYLRLK